MVLLVPAMLIAGCSGGDDDVASSTTFAPARTNPPLPTTPATSSESSADDTTTSTSASDVTAPSTTSDSSTSPSVVTVTSIPDDTAPTTDPDEFDWVAIVQELSDVLVELQGAPDPTRVTEFCFDSENDCQNVQGEAIRQFAAEGWRAIDFPRSQILSAELNSTADDLPPSEAPFVVILVDKGAADFSAARVVDADGELVFEITSDGAGGRSNWILSRNASQRWRVVSIQSLGK